jgi:predicted NBD/HSP70 family sugar kinase
VSRATLACGIDVGGTKIAGGVVDDEGTIVDQLRVESPAEDPVAIERAIASLVRQLAERRATSRPTGPACSSPPTSPGSTST